MTSQAIGFLDSGVGGLTVVKEAFKQLPNESFIFIGDQARVPYGPRPMAEVRRFVAQTAFFLVSKQIKLLVIACNTATVAALPLLRERLSIPVVGVIEAGSRKAAAVSKTGHIGVIATEGTIKSHAYQQNLTAIRPGATVRGLACPQFVTLVERGAANLPSSSAKVKRQLRPFKTQPMDTLILGCTHFPILRTAIQAAMGPTVQLVDPGAESVAIVKQVLADKHLLADRDQTPTAQFYTTGGAAHFKRVAEQWLQRDNLDVQHVALTEMQQYQLPRQTEGSFNEA
ncbi:glutamate racemase [Secundilactobacillus paracollinoides]|uniref:Glutamate racemase n=1 Tax=Secundilactobacillus paracollinoides TaxID=240427 RepID=A0A1B2J1W3_9LACO|nr:glutamate racemase [Secundilactobacillus paracollinoides]ANZ62292.1 hypothetical protein AYR61_13775 [Secundilactobacillus paracollinoides]ANZ68240.1 hypothetical protein AYR63_14650 [Secundilactobacillus paracollinoides]